MAKVLTSVSKTHSLGSELEYLVGGGSDFSALHHNLFFTMSDNQIRLRSRHEGGLHRGRYMQVKMHHPGLSRRNKRGVGVGGRSASALHLALTSDLIP